MFNKAGDKKEKAVFLDRDGVIIEEKNYLHKKEDVILIPKVAKAIELLNKNNYKVIIITNQPAVALGLCTEEDVAEINNYISNLIAKEGGRIDGAYFCPHHPEKAKITKYKVECECRKPKIGLFVKAQKDFGLDLSRCYMIGDKEIDVIAGNNASCRSILVRTGYGGREKDYDGWTANFSELTISNDLYDAVKKVILK